MARQQKHFDTRFNAGLLHPRYWGTWLVILILSLFGILPAFIRDPMSRVLAKLVMRIATKPISIARINISQCLPELTPDEVDSLIRDNVEAFILILLSNFSSSSLKPSSLK